MKVGLKFGKYLKKIKANCDIGATALVMVEDVEKLITIKKNYINLPNYNILIVGSQETNIKGIVT